MAARIPEALFAPGEGARIFDPVKAAYKREVYEKMRPRRRKFVDRLGYDNWDPYQEPNHPLDMRMDSSRRTTEELLRAFLRSLENQGAGESREFRRGALDCALGAVTRDEKFRGMMDFCLWYCELLRKEGLMP